MSLFRIDMLPGREGDCLWIEYGDPKKPRRILVDGGRQVAYATLKKRFAALPSNQRKFELLVLSHIDADHIEGLLKLITDPDLPVSFKDVWFNGKCHLDKAQNFGAVQGEALSAGILKRGWKWNAAFKGKSVVIPDSGRLPVKRLAGGMSLTVLSPTWDKLEQLAPVWERELKKAALAKKKAKADRDPPDSESYGAPTVEEIEAAAASVFVADKSEANGSSICLLAEFDGRKVVLAGDGHADVLTASLAKLREGGKRVKLNAFKLSHHGSRCTNSVDLMRQIRCKKFLISTDGSRHDHPHLESICRILKHGGRNLELRFNYESAYTGQWNVDRLKKRYGYRTVYPQPDAKGLLPTIL